jgi:hypothetical protein
MVASLGFRLGLTAIVPPEPLRVTSVATRFEPIANDLISEVAKDTEPGPHRGGIAAGGP